LPPLPLDLLLPALDAVDVGDRDSLPRLPQEAVSPRAGIGAALDLDGEVVRLNLDQR
jgi:hypothetical protein